MKVLVLVDIQNDFCPGGALAVPEGDLVVPVANRLISSGAFDIIVATKDWHPANHVSFAANHEGRNVFEQIALASGPQTLWPTHCVEGTPGAELHAGLLQDRIDHIVHKGTDPEIDSYSGFFDNNHKKETPLQGALQREAHARGVGRDDITVTICGLALDYCVAATARDAATLGLKTEVVLDGCRAVNITPGDDLRALQELASVGVEVVISSTLIPERTRTRGLEIHP
jgi:nicotinamidase/pyrazinamidase